VNPFRSPLFRKLYLCWVGFSALCLFLVYFLASRGVEEQALASIRDSLKTRAFLLGEVARQALSEKESPSLQEKVSRLGRETKTRLTVISADGTVLADSRKAPSLMENHGSRPEVLEAGKKGRGVSVRMSGTLGIRMMYLAVPVRVGDRLLGYARASLPLTLVDARLGDLKRALFLPGILAALLGLVLGFPLFGRLTSTLSQAARAADAVASGDLERRLPHQGRDEIAALGRAFNKMAGALQEKFRALEDERETLRAVLEGMVEGVIGVDREGRILYLNEGASRALGIDPKEGISSGAWEILRGRPGILAVLERAMAGEHPPEENIHIPAPGGDRILEVRAAPLGGSRESRGGAVLVLHDITRLSRLEKVRKDFVANVSHELKTPITAIQGILETLLEDREMEDQDRTEFLSVAMEQVLRLSSLVKDLLVLSRLESEEGALEARPLDLGRTAMAAWQSYLPLLEGKGLQTSLETAQVPLPLEGDPSALQAMTANLLDNAWKYTPPGGRVIMRLFEKEGSAFLEVEDTGPGIEGIHRERIFERFYRVDKARSRKLGGTGLGLSIVKHTARAHGGEVELESEPGKGSLFRVILPLAASKPHPPAGA